LKSVITEKQIHGLSYIILSPTNYRSISKFWCTKEKRKTKKQKKQQKTTTTKKKQKQADDISEIGQNAD
jgi:hypothetical protein